MNKKDLLEKIVSGRAHLEASLSRIDEERMPLIVLHGEWSVKDLIGHLGYWEGFVITLFDTFRAGKTPDPFPDLDLLNAQVLSQSRKHSLSDLRRQEKTAYQKILALIEQASEQELFNPDHFRAAAGKSFESIISDNTYGHYLEHLPELNAWLKRIS